MSSKKLILIRHGELPPKYSGHFVGSTDAPLGEKGIEDCKALAEVWRKFNSELIYVSPKLRAVQSARLVCGDSPLIVDDRLREVDFGRWENLTFDEISGGDPEYSKYWFDHPREIHFPNGEAVPDFEKRVVQFTEMLYSLPQTVITVISHGGVLTTMIRKIVDLPYEAMWRWQPSRGSLSVIDFDPENLPGRFGVFNLKVRELF